MNEETTPKTKEKKSCLGLGCLGCFGVTLITIILLIAIVIGGGYWFFRHKLLQEEAYSITSQTLSENEILNFAEKFKALETPTKEEVRITLNETELTYFIEKELDKIGEQSQSNYKDIAALGIELDDNKMDIKVSVEMDKRYLNMHIKGKPEIKNNRLRVDISECEISKLKMDNKEILTHINEGVNEELATIDINPHIKKLYVENSQLIIEVKKDID